MEEGTELLQDGFKQGKKDDFLGKATAKISEVSSDFCFPFGSAASFLFI